MGNMDAHDAVILGGGLAGLTLALHLKREFDDLDILVLERQRHPLPAAAHKVGESTVEIAAHYFDDTLGLREHLDSAHIRKFGLRYFFSDGHDDIEQATELGVSHLLPQPSYQIDRGIFETFLGEEARRRGIDFRSGATVRGFDVGSSGSSHAVRYRDDDGEHETTARWLFDASGRAGLLRRRYDLTADNGHHVNAVWFRMDTRLDVDGWSDDATWHARCTPPERWRSTNHFMGPGYWAWHIPLGSGAHSVGIVSDAGMHALDDMRDFDRALAWLHHHQPAMARELDAQRDTLLDFRFLRNYSYACKHMYSADRWALVGEAASFLDPFYSPGSDFIAFANTYAVALVGHDRAGRHLAPYARLYEQLFFTLYDNTLSLFRDQYPLFGDADVMSAKITWDYTYYWGIVCQLMFQNRLTDIDLMATVGDDLQRAQALNARMQMLFRRWHATGHRPPAPPGMRDQCRLPWFMALNRSLQDQKLDDDALRARLRENCQLLETLAATLVDQAASDAGSSLRDTFEGHAMASSRLALFPA